jgi:hypothetical protein
MLTISFIVSSDYELIVRQEPKQARMCGVGSECCVPDRFCMVNPLCVLQMTDVRLTLRQSSNCV